MNDTADRELLEMAAKAAGITPHEFRGRFYLHYVDHRDSCQDWNPLTDDGDALRLAVKLRMNVFTGVNGCDVEHGGINFSERGLDALAATRRCIVRAAAHIGERSEP